PRSRPEGRPSFNFHTKPSVTSTFFSGRLYTAWAFCGSETRGARVSSRSPAEAMSSLVDDPEPEILDHGPTSTPSMAVIIPMYNEEGGAERCVRAVSPAVSALPTRSVLVVVDGGSTDRTGAQHAPPSR